MTIPNEILTQHIAVLGKTGSGKTSTAKLLIEQVVAGGARVCVLDPIKSDWWGLTSSANGKHAGLPFHILGGPRGHVPLHASAGKAIGEIVASGALPLSIIDMADFEPGGQAKFFVDFAPTLLRKMRGVVYLVIEEAHLFAPKERSGVGAENLSIHWAKTLATAGRSKGVRLVLVTQRTQALHNALLGSCDTLIAHRLTAPADQEPVTKWLRANTTKDILQKVETTLASLKTGHAWVCSGEAKVFELVHFPRISTYDNTATPTSDSPDQVVKTAPVDQDKLRAIIGDAVKEAAANDPRELRKQLAAANAELAKLRNSANSPVQQRAEKIDRPVLTDTDREYLKEYAAALRTLHDAIADKATALLERIAAHAKAEIDAALTTAQVDATRQQADFEKRLDSKGLQKILAKLEGVAITPPFVQPRSSYAPTPALQARVTHRPADPDISGNGSSPDTAVVVGPRDPSIGNSGLSRMLIALAQRPNGLTRSQLGLRSRVSAKGGSFDTYLSKARVNGWIDSTGERIRITDSGRRALGTYEPLPSGRRLLNHYVGEFGSSGAARMLQVIADAYPEALSRAEVSERSNVSAAGGSFDTYLSKLRTLELVEGKSELRASDELFDGGQ